MFEVAAIDAGSAAVRRRNYRLPLRADTIPLSNDSLLAGHHPRTLASQRLDGSSCARVMKVIHGRPIGALAGAAPAGLSGAEIARHRWRVTRI